MPDDLSRYSAEVRQLIRDARPATAGFWRPADRVFFEYARRVGLQTDDLQASGVIPDLIQAKPSDSPRASDGQSWAIAAWSTVARLAEMGSPMPRARDLSMAIDDLLAAYQLNGVFLRKTAADSIETWTFHELQILHAVETYGIRSGDPSARNFATQSALWHVQETQPDHATSQPWGLNAMIRCPAARPLADMMLQAVQLASVDRMDAVTLLLLRDCLYCIERYEAEGITEP